MRLTSVDGSYVDLRVVAYEFPDRAGDGSGEDLDANWLVIRGEVDDGGRTSTFMHPCLTVSEAGEIEVWLRGVASGAVEADPYEGVLGDDPDEDDHGPLLVFTEPNLALDLARRSDVEAEVRVYLSAEAQPPWGRAVTGRHTYRYLYFVSLTVPLAHLEIAADEWATETARFPQR